MRRIVAPLVALVLTAGCRYTFSPNLPPGIESVAVPTVANATFEYGIEQELTAAIIEELLVNSPLTVAPEARADSLLLVTITSYVTRAVAYDVEEAVKKRELTVELEVVFRDLDAKRDLWRDTSLSERVTYYDVETGAGSGTEAEAYTESVNLLAQRVVDRIVEGW
ncbi:MAG TPA: LPS assembly lipoprotein LptE [bacterium]|nr:LPS assembly lipoprotein LptE [bacterium]